MGLGCECMKEDDKREMKLDVDGEPKEYPDQLNGSTKEMTPGDNYTLNQFVSEDNSDRDGSFAD